MKPVEGKDIISGDRLFTELYSHQDINHLVKGTFTIYQPCINSSPILIQGFTWEKTGIGKGQDAKNILKVIPYLLFPLGIQAGYQEGAKTKQEEEKDED